MLHGSLALPCFPFSFSHYSCENMGHFSYYCYGVTDIIHWEESHLWKHWDSGETGWGSWDTEISLEAITKWKTYFELWHSKMKAALQSEWAFGYGRGEWQSLPVHILHAAYRLHYLHALQLCLTGGSIISWLIIHHTKVPVQPFVHLLSFLSCHSKVRGHRCACEVVRAVGLCETTTL